LPVASMRKNRRKNRVFVYRVLISLMVVWWL